MRKPKKRKRAPKPTQRVRLRRAPAVIRPAPQDAVTALDPLRERIRRRFEAWLDEALTDGAPPEGICAELLSEAEGGEQQGQGDGYSLWSAMTALSQEVKLQGRTFKQLSDTLAPWLNPASSVGDASPARAQTLSEARAAGQDREREVARQSRRGAWKEILEVLLDLRDRLSRGLQSARAGARKVEAGAGTSWWRRLLGRAGRGVESLREAVQALIEGYALGLDRLDEALARAGVQGIPAEGKPFDPHLMRAVEVEERSEVPEGTVIGVYRTGYTWEGEVFRAAEVKVARPPRAGERGERT